MDRSDDFDRDFRPRRAVSRGRLEQLRAGAAEGGLPAIVVFEVGGAYFVEDGHHRVALALEQGADFIDAQVTSLLTEYEIGPDVDVCQLIHTEQQRWLLEETGLALARPEAVIQFTLLDGYTQLRDIVDAYGYRLLPAPRRVVDAVGGGRELARHRLPARAGGGSARGSAAALRLLAPDRCGLVPVGVSAPPRSARP